MSIAPADLLAVITIFVCFFFDNIFYFLSMKDSVHLRFSIRTLDFIMGQP